MFDPKTGQTSFLLPESISNEAWETWQTMTTPQREEFAAVVRANWPVVTLQGILKTWNKDTKHAWQLMHLVRFCCAD